MLNVVGYIWMIVVGAMCGTFAFIELLKTGAPILGLVLFGCGVMFMGGWALLAKELSDA